MSALTVIASVAISGDASPGYVRMSGPSMSPTIRPGEWVAIDPDVTQFAGEGIYLVAFERPGSVPVPQMKRLKVVEGMLMVVSDDALYPPFPAGDGLVIGGKMIGQPARGPRT